MQNSDHTAQIHGKEAHFHDHWAQSVDPKELRVHEAFEAPTAFENKWIAETMGPLQGKRLLDVGAGLGESSVYFALQGAEVTYTDISEGMAHFATQLSHLHGVSIKTIVMAGESLQLPENYFDVVYIANTIHHVTDKEALFLQIQRALKPGGRFFSIDPLKYNPVIEAYRRMATAVRTEDEAPLGIGDLQLIRKYFVNVRHREFWLSTLTLFLKYYVVDRIHPNADRYWKRIYTENAKSLWWWRPFRLLDAVLCRLPGIKWWAWNIVMWGEKAR
ncbi:MAG TPA: class I SAM-dependent methyltransferase [Bryobacteraceae bacterium]|nr:class I SAM-dependent methyltransferase [Bryobacteraceae bacterium]